MLSNLPSQLPEHLRLRQTTLSMLSGYAEWTAEHPSSILPALTYVIAALQVPQLAQSAARAIMHLCDACRKDLIPYVGDFVQLIRQLDGHIPVRRLGSRSN